jgi:hypothetical protein
VIVLESNATLKAAGWYWTVRLLINANTYVTFDGWTLTKREAQAQVKKYKAVKL